MSDIFVSYRTHDAEEVAVAIETDLSHRFGTERVFRASKSIRPGELYPQVLLRNAASCQVLVAVIGPHWLDRDADGRTRLQDADDWVRREILAAFASGARVIPVIVGRQTPSLTAKELPKPLKPLAKCQAVRYDYKRARESFDKLSHSIQAWIPELSELGTGGQRGLNGPVEAGNTQAQNTVQGGATVHGVSAQGGDLAYHQHGGIGQVNGTGSATVIHRASGPIVTGNGNQYNQFSADRSGKNSAGDDAQ